MASQQRFEVALSAVVAVPTGDITHDHTPAERTTRLVIVRVDAVVPDVRIRERDDLTGIARVGDDLLVARKRRVEHDLTSRDPTRSVGTNQLALKHVPVSKHQRTLANAASIHHDSHSCIFMHIITY